MYAPIKDVVQNDDFCISQLFETPVDKINLIDVARYIKYDVFDITIDKKITPHTDQKDIIVGSKYCKDLLRRQNVPFSFVVNGEKQDHNHNPVPSIIIVSDIIYHSKPLCTIKPVPLQCLPENTEFRLTPPARHRLS